MPSELRRFPEEIRELLEESRESAATIADDFTTHADTFLEHALELLRAGHLQEAMDLIRDARAEVLAAKAEARAIVTNMIRVQKGRG